MATRTVAGWDGYVSDRIFLEGMVFQGTHGVYPEEQVSPQPFEVDVELALNLQPAGLTDDLAQTVDYGGVYDDLSPDRGVDPVQPDRGAGGGDRPRAAGRTTRPTR